MKTKMDILIYFAGGSNAYLPPPTCFFSSFFAQRAVLIILVNMIDSISADIHIDSDIIFMPYRERFRWYKDESHVFSRK